MANGCPRDIFYLLVLAMMGILMMNLQANCGDGALLTPKLLRHRLRQMNNVPVVEDQFSSNFHPVNMKLDKLPKTFVEEKQFVEEPKQMEVDVVEVVGVEVPQLDDKQKIEEPLQSEKATTNTVIDLISSEMYGDANDVNDSDSEEKAKMVLEKETIENTPEEKSLATISEQFQVDDSYGPVESADSVASPQDITLLETSQGNEKTNDEEVDDDILGDHNEDDIGDNDEDHADDFESDDEVDTSISDSGDLSRYFDIHFTDDSGKEDPIIVLKPQFKHNKHKYFKAVGTKFIALFRAFQRAGWIQQPETYPTINCGLVLTKPVTSVMGSHGRMISQISSSSCIGGSKGAQLRCRKHFAESQGCAFSDLGISPAQYNLWSKQECKSFFEAATRPEHAEKYWIGKPGGSYHGRGISIFQGIPKNLQHKYSKCSMDKETGGGYIVMDYIHSPATLGGHKFDLRTYMLVAATAPYLVFYHNGFVRRSGAKYSSDVSNKLAHITNHAVQDKVDNHFWGFDQTGEVLAAEHGFPEDFMQTAFKNKAKHVTNYVFQAARSRMKRRGGAFMLFGLDWMIDSDQGIHMLEANGNPSIKHYEGTGLTPAIWDDMATLVTKIHREPNEINPAVAQGYKWGGWELVFSEPEEVYTSNRYNPCKFEEYLRCTDPDVCDQW